MGRMVGKLTRTYLLLASVTALSGKLGKAVFFIKRMALTNFICIGDKHVVQKKVKGCIINEGRILERFVCCVFLTSNHTFCTDRFPPSLSI